MRKYDTTFVDNCVRYFYNVFISGYHIADAGATPISQLTLLGPQFFNGPQYLRHDGGFLFGTEFGTLARTITADVGL